MQKFSIAERRNRLARRHFLYRNGLESIAGVNAGLVGLHAIDPATPDMPPWCAVPVDLHGSPGYAPADDVEPEPDMPPWCALLPGLDATTTGWYQRDWYLGEHRGQVFDANANAGPAAWWNGRVAGGSHQDASNCSCWRIPVVAHAEHCNDGPTNSPPGWTECGSARGSHRG